MAFTITREFSTTLVTSTGVIVGTQSTSASVLYTVESITIDSTGTASAYLTSQIAGGPVENAGMFPFTLSTSSGISPLLQAEVYIRSLDDFASAVDA